MVGVLLLEWTESSRRQKIGPERRRWQFPEPPWLAEELQSAEFVGNKVRPVLANISPGTPYTGALTPWDFKTWLWWNFLERPRDGFSVFVDDRFVFDGVEVQQASKYARHLCFQWQLPDQVDELFGLFTSRDGVQQQVSGQEACHRLQMQDRDIIALLVPSRLLFLLQKGLFNTLLFVDRWRVGNRNPRRLELFADYPPPTWRASAEAIGVPDVEPKIMSVKEANKVAWFLRKHALAILDSVVSEEDKHSIHLELEESLHNLDAHARLSNTENKRHTSYDAEWVIRAVCVAAQMRHRGELREMLDKVLPLMFPWQDAQVLADLSFKQTASKSTLHRYQLVVDAALCGQVRENLRISGPGPIWLWCDSSPQAGEVAMGKC